MIIDLNLHILLDSIIVILSGINAIIAGLNKNWSALLGWTMGCLGFLKCIVLFIGK